MTITLREERIKESDEVCPGVIADFGFDGGVIRFEILDASKVVPDSKSPGGVGDMPMTDAARQGFRSQIEITPGSEHLFP